MVWKLDDSVGKIIAALGHQKMLQDTIIVLTTDNGGAVAGYDNSVGSNWPLRGVRRMIMSAFLTSIIDVKRFRRIIRSENC